MWLEVTTRTCKYLSFFLPSWSCDMEDIYRTWRNKRMPVKSNILQTRFSLFYFILCRTMHLNLKRKEMFQWSMTVSCGLTQVLWKKSWHVHILWRHFLQIAHIITIIIHYMWKHDWIEKQLPWFVSEYLWYCHNCTRVQLWLASYIYKKYCLESWHDPWNQYNCKYKDNLKCI